MASTSKLAAQRVPLSISEKIARTEKNTTVPLVKRKRACQEKSSTCTQTQNVHMNRTGYNVHRNMIKQRPSDLSHIFWCFALLLKLKSHLESQFWHRLTPPTLQFLYSSSWLWLLFRSEWVPFETRVLEKRTFFSRYGLAFRVKKHAIGSAKHACCLTHCLRLWRCLCLWRAPGSVESVFLYSFAPCLRAARVDLGVMRQCCVSVCNGLSHVVCHMIRRVGMFHQVELQILDFHVGSGPFSIRQFQKDTEFC